MTESTIAIETHDPADLLDAITSALRDDETIWLTEHGERRVVIAPVPAGGQSALTDLLAAARAVVPALELLGDFIGNTFDGKPGIPAFDRCAVILALRDALATAESIAGEAGRAGGLADYPGTAAGEAPRPGEDITSRRHAAAVLTGAGVTADDAAAVLRRAHGHLSASSFLPGTDTLAQVTYDRDNGQYSVTLPPGIQHQPAGPGLIHCSGCGAEIQEQHTGLWETSGDTADQRRHCTESHDHLHHPSPGQPSDRVAIKVTWWVPTQFRTWLDAEEVSAKLRAANWPEAADTAARIARREITSGDAPEDFEDDALGDLAYAIHENARLFPVGGTDGEPGDCETAETYHVYVTPGPAAGRLIEFRARGEVARLLVLPDDQPRRYIFLPVELDLLIRSAGELWDSTGGQDPHDVLSGLHREALDLAAAAWRGELDRYPKEKLDLLIRSAGELWDSIGEQDLHRGPCSRLALPAPGRKALDHAAALFRYELRIDMGGSEEPW